jgi:hypothetical protein
MGPPRTCVGCAPPSASPTARPASASGGDAASRPVVWATSAVSSCPSRSCRRARPYAALSACRSGGRSAESKAHERAARPAACQGRQLKGGWTAAAAPSLLACLCDAVRALHHPRTPQHAAPHLAQSRALALPRRPLSSSAQRRAADWQVATSSRAWRCRPRSWGPPSPPPPPPPPPSAAPPPPPPPASRMGLPAAKPASRDSAQPSW